MESADSPKHPDGHFVLGLDEFANVHPSPSAAGNLKDVTVRGAHFKYAILVSESFYGTLYLYVGCIDHCSHSREEKDQQQLGRSRGKLNGCSGSVNRHRCGYLRKSRKSPEAFLSPLFLIDRSTAAPHSIARRVSCPRKRRFFDAETERGIVHDRKCAGSPHNGPHNRRNERHWPGSGI